MEKALVARAGIPYEGISTGQIMVGNPLKAAKGLLRMGAGVRQSLGILGRFRPDVCLVTGGYVCGPVAMACAIKRIPVLIYLPDMVPGQAIRWLSKVAGRVAVTFPEVSHWFGGEAPAGKAVVTGYPVRQELVTAAADRQGARAKLAASLRLMLSEPDGSQLPLVLIWGGSSGARVINEATWGSANELVRQAQVLHVVGTRDWPLAEAWLKTKPLVPATAHRYHPVPYLYDAMPLALAGADLTVARAGASTLGEFPVARLASILVPLIGVNQLENAKALANRGGAVIVLDEALGDKLASVLNELLGDPARLAQMEAALASLARPDAALAIADELVALAKG
jgi:UDP-N-acetylglucosamine--N-acetylmuramyl-(pentapeptide) pyrophosphoryl-undecaprenol N-acetylglucosamine transferase